MTEPGKAMAPGGDQDGQALVPLDALAAWIKIGAPLPDGKTAVDGAAWKKHWAFQAVANPALPAVKLGTWPRTTVDRGREWRSEWSYLLMASFLSGAVSIFWRTRSPSTSSRSFSVPSSTNRLVR